MEPPRLDLRPDHWVIVQDILQRHIPDRKVLAFGSRATWTANDYSDLDLAIMGDKPLPLETASALSEDFEESDLPFKVDLVDWANADKAFQGLVCREGITVQQVRPIEEDDWERKLLGDCIEIKSDTFAPSESWPTIKYLDTGNITENRINKIQELIVGKDKIPSSARRKVQAGDIVYSRVRPNRKHFGILKKVPENLVVSAAFSVIRGKIGTAHTNFVYWFLTQPLVVDQIQAIAEHSSSVYPSIRPSDIAKLKIDLPPLTEQRAIAHILDTLDSKIELNWRMNETLESMARTLFKSWFVDFDPVRAKMENRDTGLPEHIADLFPDRLIESDREDIPEGWGWRPVSDFASIKGGKQLPKDKFIEHGSVPVFGGAGQMGHTDDYNADGYVISVGRVGAYCGQFFAHRGRAWVNNNASRIMQKEGVPGEWLLLALQNLNMDLIKKGAAQPFVSNSDLAAMKIISPSDGVLRVFQRFLKPVSLRLDQTKVEMNTTMGIRDTLLPKLISGELRQNRHKGEA